MSWSLFAVLGLASAGAAEPTPPLASEMHARFFALAAARDAVVQGRLADATAAIRPLAVRDATEPFPAAWRPMVIAVEAAALRVAESPDLPTAAARVPTVAVACAECHTATGGGPAVTDTAGGPRGPALDNAIPAQKWVAGQNMPLHRWAVDWMWLGLVADSDDAWLRGARELDAQPLAMRFEDAPPPGGMQQLEQLVYVIANKALTTDGQTDRAALMGNLLGTCAQCHIQRDQHLKNAKGGGK